MATGPQLSVRIAVLVAAAFAFNAVGCVGIRYIRLIDNDPLSNSLLVVDKVGNVLTLEDGRTITLALNERDLEIYLNESGNRIELQPSFGHHVDIYAKVRQTICGTGAPAITIPLVPVYVPKYRRMLVDAGELSNQ